MFGRHMEIKFVKNAKAKSQEEPIEKKDIDYAEIAEVLGKKLVVGIVTVIAAHVILGTASHLIVQSIGNKSTN